MIAMFVTATGKISLQDIPESPERICGLVRTWVRTGSDPGVYEQASWEPLRSLALAEEIVRGIKAERELQEVR